MDEVLIMKEAVILQSPHAVDPMETLTKKEKAENGTINAGRY